MGLSEKILRVDVAAAPYDIFIGAGILASAGSRLQKILPSCKICIITDENVAPLYLGGLTGSFEKAGFSVVPPLVLPAGENTKNFGALERVIDHAVEHRLDRNAVLVALGGGVIGDLAGFAAAVFMRGISFVQVPTTLMAQVDSAVGGKTAVNTARGKNMAGAFHQPRAVLADTAVLKTLPPREIRAGYAEILKCALVSRPGFFDWLERNGAGVLNGDAAAQLQAIDVSCAIKAEIVAADEKEQKDIRALLNLGHTFGHALEALGGYDGRLLHGEAVAIGLRLMLAFCAERELCPPETAARVLRHMDALGLAGNPPFPVSAAELLDKMRGDKKAGNGTINLVLLRGPGAAYVDRNVREKDIAAFLQQRFGS